MNSNHTPIRDCKTGTAEFNALLEECAARIEEALGGPEEPADWQADAREKAAKMEAENNDLVYRAEPIQDNPGYRACSCEDYPCCGHGQEGGNR